MKTILHILTKPDDSLARIVLDAQEKKPDTTLVVVDLTQPNPDYEVLVERVFAADSVEVW